MGISKSSSKDATLGTDFPIYFSYIIEFKKQQQKI